MWGIDVPRDLVSKSRRSRILNQRREPPRPPWRWTMDADAILYGLNDAQRASVTSPASVLQVLAPPGSGKTKTLTARVAYLIAHRGLKPWNIITCTFTRKAANEMRERIRGLIGDETAKQIKLGTFHAIAVQYLRQYGQHIGLEKGFGIADSADSKAILNRIIKRYDFTIQARQALGRISSHKAKGVTSEDVARAAKKVDHQEFAQVFVEYEAELKASNLLDYDDLLLRCCGLMKLFPQCVSNVEAVLIDEFQDTNITQYELMGLFAQQRMQITIVGDPDQSIYGFRSAEIKNLLRMKEQCPDTLTINLQENYRSSGAILRAAQNIIEQDPNRPPKKLQATHSLGLRPVLRKLPTAGAEAAWLVSEVKRMAALSAGVVDFSDFAILLRAVTLSRVIESALAKEGVPYRMVGGTRFYDRAEVKLMLDYLRVIHESSNNEAVERIINVPSRKVGDVTVKNLRDEASVKKCSLFTLVMSAARGEATRTKLTAPAQRGLALFVNVILSGQRKLLAAETISLLELTNHVITKIDLQAYLKQKYDTEHEARWSNVEELLAQATEMSDPAKLQALAEEQALPVVDDLDQRPDKQDALSVFLANVALTASAEAKTDRGEVPSQQVTITTIHSAKGLEWPVVFVPGCFEGSIPHSRAEDNDEERRLLYVAMTRAQAMLYLSCPSKNSQREGAMMSSFLAQPGVNAFFEEHGPSMSHGCACGLARTLRRDAPSAADFETNKKTLENDEDNYWPLNGDSPLEELAKWERAIDPSVGISNSSSSLLAGGEGTQQDQNDRSGFSSVKDRYEELMEQGRLKNIEKRADAAAAKAKSDAPSGRKRHIEGQSTLSNFLAKRQHISSSTEDSMPSNPSDVNISRKAPLRELPNFNNIHPPSASAPLSKATSVLSSHKIRTTSFRPVTFSSTATTTTNTSTYNTSISRTGVSERHNSSSNDLCDSTGAADEDRNASLSSRHATTLHTTSMQTLQQQTSTRKTYGVKPSFNGWANRARK